MSLQTSQGASWQKRVLDLLAPVHARLERGNRPDNWKMPGYPTPCSISETEGAILADWILRYRLANAVEVGTGFGYSALWLGWALQQTGGRLVSLDNYMEECLGHRVDSGQSGQVNADSEGLRFARESIMACGLERCVLLHTGVWPGDVPGLIAPNVDLLFVDGHHYGDAPSRDFLACAPFLNPDGCAVFFHDSAGPSVTAAVQTARETLRRAGRSVHRILWPTTCFLECVTTLPPLE